MARRKFEYVGELGDFCHGWHSKGTHRWVTASSRRKAAKELRQYLKEYYADTHFDGFQIFRGKEPHRMLAFRLRRGYKSRKRFQTMWRPYVYPPACIRRELRRQHVARYTR